jgi:FAD/FMN-containing dehydrogenase
MDLSKLNTISLDSKGTTASIGPGARWGDVYNYLSLKGVSVAGGRAASVGVGGLTVGGGFQPE